MIYNGKVLIAMHMFARITYTYIYIYIYILQSKFGILIGELKLVEIYSSSNKF